MKRIKLARGFICSTDSRFANQPRSVNCCTNPRNRELCPYDGDRASLHQKSREGKEKKDTEHRNIFIDCAESAKV